MPTMLTKPINRNMIHIDFFQLFSAFTSEKVTNEYEAPFDHKSDNMLLTQEMSNKDRYTVVVVVSPFSLARTVLFS
jgi:hypothetical protein